MECFGNVPGVRFVLERPFYILSWYLHPRCWLSSWNFFGGGGAKCIVMRISFVMLTFLLFSDEIFGGIL